MSQRLKGLKKVQAVFDAKLKEIEGVVSEEAIKDVAFDLLGKAKLLAPIDTGDLRGSGFVEFVETTNGIGAIIGFSTPYAVRQHEELDYHHPQGGQAKYLEQPFKENTQRYVKHLADSVKKAVD
jgi:hypothetical protein